MGNNSKIGTLEHTWCILECLYIINYTDKMSSSMGIVPATVETGQGTALRNKPTLSDTYICVFNLARNLFRKRGGLGKACVCFHVGALSPSISSISMPLKGAVLEAPRGLMKGDTTKRGKPSRQRRRKQEPTVDGGLTLHKTLFVPAICFVPTYASCL